MIISPGMFNSQINEIKAILKAISLFKEQNFHPSDPSHHLQTIRRLDYPKLWEFFFKNAMYNYLLEDNSIVIFINEDNTLSYSYYECPVIEEPMNGRGFSDYNPPVAPVRYDYDPQNYGQAHPASHLHVGFKNNIRVGSDRILTPISFVLFIIRQYYPEEWLLLLENPRNNIWCRNIRRDDLLVPNDRLDFSRELILR
ncbi:MAG: DUF2290 domain-containing protein [Candidatus Heimdallarchaeota archaeon]